MLATTHKKNAKMNYFFSSESVSAGHPDKVADQISDALLDNFIALDPQSHVACETLVTTGQVVLAGEVTTDGYVDVQKVARDVIDRIGYNKSDYMFEAHSCGVLSSIHEQSADINRGVSRQNPMEQGAGDQGIMFGYACSETKNYMPVTIDMAHAILKELDALRKEGRQMPYLRPDAKSQVTVEYSENGKPLRIEAIVVSTQHDEFDSDDDKMLKRIEEDVKNILLPRVFAKDKAYSDLNKGDFKLFVNPTGKFVIGGPHGDTGLTGRKIIVDTYGGRGAHGGGAFSGKDPSKVDRSAAYAARHIAKNLVAAGVCDEVLIQVAYAIGVAEPMNLYINTCGTNKTKFTDAEIAAKLPSIFDMRPYAIEQRLKLRNPIYEETASYGHFGREPKIVKKQFSDNGKPLTKEVELFTWEKLDAISVIKEKIIK